MMLKRTLHRCGPPLVILGLVCMIACGPHQTNTSNERPPDAASPTTTVTPLNSERNTNKQAEKPNKTNDEMFAESPPLDLPECLAYEAVNIAAMRSKFS